MHKILIVEDDIGLREELKKMLEKSGYQAEYLKEFDHTCEEIISRDADLVLLDINLPCISGESILKELRKKSEVPVIMVTSKNTEMDELICMSFGADDFISKPFHPSILLLHIEAVLKRVSHSEHILQYGKIWIDAERGILKMEDKAVELSKNELKILSCLIQRQGSVVSRDELMDYLWNTEEFVDDNTLTVNINRVRKKLEENGLADLIKTKRGRGYILE